MINSKYYRRKNKILKKNNKKLSLVSIIKDYWKFISSIFIVICGITFWAYLYHLHNLIIFVDLITENTITIFMVLIPFMLISFAFLIFLGISGLISSLYLNNLNFYKYERSKKQLIGFIFIAILISASPIIIYIIISDFFPDNKSLFVIILITVILLCSYLYFLIIKSNVPTIENNKKIKDHIKQFGINCAHLFCLCFIPFMFFHLTGLFQIFRFVTGDITIKSGIILGVIIIFFAFISVSPLICYFINCSIKKFKDSNDLLIRTIKGSFCFNVSALLIVFVCFHKTFVFVCYLSLRLLGVVDLSSNYEFIIINNEINVLKLQKKWEINDSESDNYIIISGTIGFHIGNVYIICKDNFKKLFMDSLKYDLANSEFIPLDYKSCIKFSKNDLEILTIVDNKSK